MPSWPWSTPNICPLRLKDSSEAEDQIAFADVVLLNKTDLVDEDDLASVEATIRTINPSVRIHRTERANIELASVLDRGAFDLQRALDNDPHFLEHEDHDHSHPGHHRAARSDIHDSSVQSISLRAGPLKPDLFFPWIQKITQMDGPNILRLKGIIAFDNDDERYIVQGIHMIVEGDHQRPWKDEEDRESRIVFIGRDLDKAKLKRTFEACQAKN